MISTRAQSPNKSLALREDVPLLCTLVVADDMVILYKNLIAQVDMVVFKNNVAG